MVECTSYLPNWEFKNIYTHSNNPHKVLKTYKVFTSNIQHHSSI